nr:tRNA lysidine(34) synthetase TilS [Nitrospirota bacterium]
MHRITQTQRKSTQLAQRVARHAKATGLIEPGQRLLIAVSGGPDSVALLSVLKELSLAWRLTLYAAHINYGLRGEESEEDARFVARLCDRFGITLHCERVTVARKGSVRDRSSLQERAREARYRILTELGRTLTADRIVLGHQADDQAETVLMWMLRGAGVAGLTGIPPIRESLFIRPLLGISREAILEYLWSRELPFRLDSSNAKPLYLRNRIRHELLPVMKRLNPSIVEGLARQADILREDDAYLHRLAYEAMVPLVHATDQGVMVDRTGFLALPLTLQRRILRILLQDLHPRRKGPGYRAIASLLATVFEGRTGSSTTIQGVLVTHEYGTVRLQPDPPSRMTVNTADDVTILAANSLALPVPSVTRWPLTGQLIRVSLGPRFLPSSQVISRNQACLDLDRVSTPLTVRAWKSGDAFQPVGMGGRTKKLQDYFSDIKLPRQARALVPIIQAQEGILWVAGHRTDHRFCARVGTQRTLLLELLEPTSEGGTG